MKLDHATKMLTKKKVRNNTVKADEPIQRPIGRKWNNITMLIPGDQGCQFESPNRQTKKESNRKT
jgi:hypothetical protein